MPVQYRKQHSFGPIKINMTQNGKRMTADEFDAWMKARGVRVVGRKEAPAAASGTASEPQATPSN